MGYPAAKWVPASLLSAVLCGCGAATQLTGASCAAPALAAVPATSIASPGREEAAGKTITVFPGQGLRIYGFGYETCHDTNMQPPASPYATLKLFVTQGHDRQALGTASAKSPGGTFAVTVRLPAGLRSGPATIRTSQPVETPAHLRVRQRG